MSFEYVLPLFSIKFYLPVHLYNLIFTKSYVCPRAGKFIENLNNLLLRATMARSRQLRLIWIFSVIQLLAPPVLQLLCLPTLVSPQHSKESGPFQMSDRLPPAAPQIPCML